MKKIVLFIGTLFICLVKVQAKGMLYEIDGMLGPSFRTATAVTASSSTITADAGNRNCLTNWSLMSTTISNMTIIDGALNGGTTIWGLVSVPASTPINVTTTEENAICGSFNSQMMIVVSSGTASISYRGYTRRSP